MWRIAVFVFSVLALSSLLACARNHLGSRWGIDMKICSRSVRDVLFPLANRIVRVLIGKAFMRLLDDSSFKITDEFLAFRHTREVDLFESFCIGWFRYSLAKGTAELAETFTVIGRKRATDENTTVRNSSNS